MTILTEPLKIDFVSDIVCPWCIIGYRQLARALKDTNTEYEIRWHPFELNPDMSPEGQNIGEHLAEKYGSTREQSLENRARITQVGSELGFDFQFADDMRMHNTFNAHQLICWAGEVGLEHELEQALFSAHFTNRQNLSDINVLIDIAEKAGLEREMAAAVLADQRYADEVRRREIFWLQQGIQGVPAVIFDNKHLVSGAQGVENFTHILKQLAEMRAKEGIKNEK